MSALVMGQWLNPGADHDAVWAGVRRAIASHRGHCPACDCVMTCRAETAGELVVIEDASGDPAGVERTEFPHIEVQFRKPRKK